MSDSESASDVRHHIRRRRRNLAIALGVVVAIAAPTVTALFATQVIEVVVEPSDAEAALSREDGVLATLGRRIFLVSGEGAVTVAALGFSSQRIAVARGTASRLAVSLDPLPGIVSLVIDSNREFLIRVDGQIVGTESELVVELAPGTHKVEIEGPGIGLEREIEVAGRGARQTFTFAPGGPPGLTPDAPPEAVPGVRPGTKDVATFRPQLAVAAEPSFARILIDGVAVGTGRYSGAIAPGIHELAVEAENHAPHRSQFEIPADASANDLGTIALTPLPAVVSIRSAPAGATVLVDGRYRGDTPLRVEVAAGGERRLSIHKAGFRSVDDVVRPGPNARIQRDYDLSRRSYRARVTANRPADIAVNGRVVGTAPLTVDIADNDEITAVAEGYRAKPVRVRPGGGENREYAFRLVEPGRFAFEAADAEVAAPGGIRLRKFAPLRFDARETAQAPPKTVELTRAFYFAVNETTVAAFRAFKSDYPAGQDANLPAVSVTWQDAARFCNWLSAKAGLTPAYAFEGAFAKLDLRSPGFRLPTEAEWEAVARYDFARGGVRGRPYAWGAGATIPPGFANVAGRELREQGVRFLDDHADNHPGVAPVGTYPPNFNGIHDLAGNVSEWVNDYYRSGPFAPDSGADPLGPAVGTDHVVKGANFLSADRSALSPGYRAFAANKSESVGFRVARWIR